MHSMIATMPYYLFSHRPTKRTITISACCIWSCLQVMKFMSHHLASALLLSES